MKTQRKASQLAATQPRLADAIPRQPDTIAVWQTFEASLANVLLLLEEDEYLIIGSKRHQHYVQFAGEGPHGMRAEAVSNAFIDNPADRLTDAQHEQIAALACATLRHVYGVPRPGELEYTAFHGAGDDIRFPSLRLRRRVPPPRAG